jgi:hypothetical protein
VVVVAEGGAIDPWPAVRGDDPLRLTVSDGDYYEDHVRGIRDPSGGQCHGQGNPERDAALLRCCAVHRDKIVRSFI